MQLEEIHKINESKKTSTRREVATNIETIKFICFKLNSEEFAIEIKHIKEIIQLPLVTRVAKAPDFIEGITNLRGDILQLINLHRIMELENIPMTEKSRIIVLDDNNILTGIIADSINGVFEVEKEVIQLTPDIIAANKAKFLKGIIKPNEHRSILWFDSKSIYSDMKKISNKNI